MVRKTASELRDYGFSVAERALSAEIGTALRQELGSSRRATKTVMRWTGVSDTTARTWINGGAVPSGLHLLALASHCQRVMAIMLRSTGHGDFELALELQEIEKRLLAVLASVRMMISARTEVEPAPQNP